MADEVRTVLIDIEIDPDGDANKSITTLDKSINSLTDSKDESAESTKKLSKESKGLTDNTKKSKTATDSMTKSVAEYAKKLGPAALAVGALIAIGKGLIESLKTNKAFMDALSIETAALSGVMDKLKADVGEATIEFLGLSDAIDETGKATTLTDKAIALFAGFLASTGFTSAAAYTASLISVSQAAAEVERIHIEARDGLAAFNLEVGILNLEYEEQIALTRELDQTTTQQLETLAGAQRTFEEIAKVTQTRIDLEVRLQREALAAADGSIAQKVEEDKLNEVLLKQATTIRGLSARRRELLNRQKEATNRLIAEEKAHQTFITTIEKENAELDKLIEKTGLLADVTVESEEKQTAAFEKSLEKSLTASDKRIAKSQEEVDNAIEGEKAKAKAIQDGFDLALGITGALKGLNIENAAFNKQIAIAETIINTARAIVATLPNIPLSIGVGIIGAAQLATIIGTEFKSGGMLEGPSHARGGININAEGGEAIINKTSMANPILRSLASDINVAGGGKRFQFGGIVGNVAPSLDSTLSGLSNDFERAFSKAQPVLVLEDLNIVQNKVNVQEDMATL